MFRRVATAAVLVLLSQTATAAPITTPPPVLTATGDVKAVFVFSDAANISFLDEVTPVGWSNIFCNHPSGSCSGNTPGNTMDLGEQWGPLSFRLRNISAGKSYRTNAADSHGHYHAVFNTDYASFGLGALPTAAAAALAGLTNVTFVAWEDLDASNGSDFDYNDLVFAFSNTTGAGNPEIPEPLSLSLMGAGLLGLAGIAWRKARR